MTFTCFFQIWWLTTNLSLESIVLETDVLDIAPTWLARGEVNTPDQILLIAQVLADFRGLLLHIVASQMLKRHH